MEFNEGMRIYNRICIEHGVCVGCPLSKVCITRHQNTDIDKIKTILKKWAAEHPERTIADDFFEKHPNAEKDLNGVPYMCAMKCGYVNKCRIDRRCEKCWWQPLEEQNNGKS